MELKKDIGNYLLYIGGGDAHGIAKSLGVPELAVQEILIAMDDSGDVLMRNGWYRPSEAYKARAEKNRAGRFTTNHQPALVTRFGQEETNQTGIA